MSPRGAYIPLHQYPTPSLAHSRLFNSEFGAPQPSILSKLPRPSTRSIAISLGAAVVLFILLYPRSQLTWIQQALQGEGIDYRLGFNELYSASRTGWREYEPTIRSAENLDTSQLRSWVDKLSDDCVESLVARGEICEDWPREPAGVDAVWTWSNGTDPLLQVWRAEVTAVLSGKVSSGVSQVRAAKRARHFRDHDELRYSIRSALNSFSSGLLRNLHVLTTDLPPNILLRDTIYPPRTTDTEDFHSKPVVDSSRLGQVPQWLAKNTASSLPSLSITHHSDFFSNKINLPTFNSLSIESQFPFMSSIEAEFFLYLNDDTFLLGEDSLVETDVGSPLLGQVFRLQRDLTVGSTSPTQQVLNPEGEWSSLERANWLLDCRFGVRQRNYLAHIPKAMSMPILQEVGMIWKEELEQTASSRFRGRNVEFQLAFLATHFTIESHRQALLLAFIVGRIDRDTDGSLSIVERRQMLSELGFKQDDEGNWGGESVVVASSVRSTRNNLPTLLAQAGLHPPRSTLIRCSSMDGHCASQDDSKRPASEEVPFCKIRFDECFGNDFLTKSSVPTLEVFKDVSFRRVECGDCIIARLVSTSGSTGLSSFLHEDDFSDTPDTTRRPFNLHSASSATPAKAFEDLTFSSSPSKSRRLDAAREILRYSYVLGDSKSKFLSMRTPRDTARVLKEVMDADFESNKNLTFLTLNDDFPNDHVSEMSQPILDDFFQSTWPNPSPYET
ncbi:hypothetical protein JCM3765_002145 [Sporobolomyces pararoseus]